MLSLALKRSSRKRDQEDMSGELLFMSIDKLADTCNFKYITLICAMINCRCKRIRFNWGSDTGCKKGSEKRKWS